MSSIIFIGSPEKSPNKSHFRDAFIVDPLDILFRIFASFVPPLMKKYRVVFVDFLGPSLALLLLAGVVNYGYSTKNSDLFIGPNEFLLFYCFTVPTCFYFLSKLGQSDINLSEIVSLFGYALYGHLFTLVASYVCFQEESDAFFFCSLILFCGLSTLRLVLVVLKTISRPGLRLIVCSSLAILQILSLIFIHFGFMHRTYKYRGH